MNASSVHRVAALSILGIALASSLGGAAGAGEAAAPGGPLGLVKSSVARVLDIIQRWPAGSEERRAQIVGVSHELFDYDEMARRALGTHWQGLSARDQDEFIRLFRDVLERAFVASVDGYTGETVAFVGEAVDGAWAEVRSRIIPKRGAAVSIDYRLHAAGARWTVYDVLSERVSLVANYRSQFNAVLRASSFAELLDRMRADPLRRRESGTGPPSVADSRWPSPAAHGSSHHMEVRR